MSCLTLRTKSPPVTTSSAMTSARSSPDAHPWAAAKKPGSGIRVRGRPAAASAALRSDGQPLQLDPPPLHLPRREPHLGLLARHRPRRWPDTRRAWNVNDEARAATRGRVEVVEQAVAQGVGHQQVALVVDPGQAAAGVGEGPAVDVAPHLEHPQHPVELAGQRLGAALDPPLQPAQVLLQPLGPLRRPQVAAHVGTVGHRVRLRRAGHRAGRVRGPAPSPVRAGP